MNEKEKKMTQLFHINLINTNKGERALDFPLSSRRERTLTFHMIRS